MRLRRWYWLVVLLATGCGGAVTSPKGPVPASLPPVCTVRGFVIQNFKTPLQQGTIQDFNGPDWIIRNNHITDNSAAGVATGDGCVF